MKPGDYVQDTRDGSVWVVLEVGITSVVCDRPPGIISPSRRHRIPMRYVDRDLMPVSQLRLDT